MGSSKGGGGNPAAFTGGGLALPPPPTGAPPVQHSYLPASGSVMATPESIAQAFASRPPPPPPQAFQPAGLPPDVMRQMIAEMIAKQTPRPINREFNPQGMRWGGYAGNTVGQGSGHGGR
jgi:hypothetical protein